MSTSGISSVVSSYVQQVTGSTASQAAPTVASAVQEATETLATTIKEARNGDPVAKLKLKQLQAKQPQAEPTKPASEPGKGELVDSHA